MTAYKLGTYPQNTWDDDISEILFDNGIEYDYISSEASPFWIQTLTAEQHVVLMEELYFIDGHFSLESVEGDVDFFGISLVNDDTYPIDMSDEENEDDV